MLTSALSCVTTALWEMELFFSVGGALKRKLVILFAQAAYLYFEGFSSDATQQSTEKAILRQKDFTVVFPTLKQSKIKRFLAT